MQDKISKNTFSPELAEDLIHAFETIKTQTQYKTVIFIGYSSYFAS
jgi:enoyl-CoA hydratase/carnithine racemase